MSQIKVVPLGIYLWPYCWLAYLTLNAGAGQDVGRSCVVVTIGNKNIMFDCGMHMGYNDERSVLKKHEIGSRVQRSKIIIVFNNYEIV
jgi:predicted metal-dependent RNase